jgi:hypothetical protein
MPDTEGAVLDSDVMIGIIPTSDDTNFGGYLITPTGSRVALVFENNLWRVPLWVPPMRSPVRHVIPVKVLAKSDTTNFLPAP